MLDIFIDADACSVKDETYKVAARFKLKTFVVANQYLNVPLSPNIRMEVVSGGFDAADDWIVEKIQEGDVLITSDLLLADRAIKKGARVIGQKGSELDENNIGNALASREISQHLRDLGQSGTGPSSMTKKDRSQFLSKLDQVLHSIKRKYDK
ncbi:MAG: YaiI/YqxD family protein [Bdellovibrionales bacterium]